MVHWEMMWYDVVEGGSVVGAVSGVGGGSVVGAVSGVGGGSEAGWRSVQ